MVRRHPYGWIDRWFDVSDVWRVDALSELCPCTTVTDRRHLGFDRTLVDLLRRPPFVRSRTLLLCGLFQSWRYVEAVDDELRQRLRWKPSITAAVSGCSYSMRIIVDVKRLYKVYYV